MDSRSDGDRSEEVQINSNHNMKNAKEPMEKNGSKILSPELHDIFPIFANMLDFKSFMKLAMTSKGMYKRCMEDKAIKINIEENYFTVYNNDGVPGFLSDSSPVRDEHINCYLSTLRKQHFNINLIALGIFVESEVNNSILDAAYNYMEEFGVKSIKKLKISGNFMEWESAIPFMKKFGVQRVTIYDRIIPLPTLRSWLQLDLEKFSFELSAPVDFLLELESPIPDIRLFGATGQREIQKDKFMQILWKIQTGSLKHLSLWRDFVDLSLYNTLPFGRKDPLLPDERPLVFHRTEESNGDQEYYFLHWQGGITKCVQNGSYAYRKIFKCPPCCFPPILRKDEEVMNDLSKRLPEVGCYESQFNRFAESFSFLHSSFNGPFPTKRPLYFKATQGFWELDEDDRLMECAWNNNQATWKPYLKDNKCKHIGNRALAKFLFRQRIQEPIDCYFMVHCSGRAQFDSWFDDLTKLDFEHSAPLPVERPLVFERPPSMKRPEKCYIVLFEDRLVQCELSSHVGVKECHPCNRPPILINTENVKKVFQETNDFEIEKGLDIRMDLETFRAGWEHFKTFPHKTEWHRTFPFVFEMTPDQNDEDDDDKPVERHWYYSIAGEIVEVSWKDGRAMFSASDPHKIPFEFIKEIFDDFVQTDSGSIDKFYLNREQFNRCIEQFKAVPFHYSGPLTKGSRLAFKETAIRHTCSNGFWRPPFCGCKEIFYRYWLIWNGVNVTYCSWGEEEPCQVKLHHYDSKDMPPVLKSKEYLRNLVETYSDVIDLKSWYGTRRDFIATFERYTKISPDHKGPLPEKRPLLVERDTEEKSMRYLLRGDGKIIQCRWGWGDASIMVVYPFVHEIPTVLMPPL